VRALHEDPRAHALRDGYHARFGGAELPVPIEAIAEDMLGLLVEEAPGLPVSGMLVPAERRVVLSADEGLPRRRFTLAHELGHWVCQCLDKEAAPIYCRAADITLTPEVRALEREANIFAAELLMPEAAVLRAWSELGEIAACAARFSVSTTAIHWRLYGFNLVEEAPS
jgi:hypothetical protein